MGGGWDDRLGAGSWCCDAGSCCSAGCCCCSAFQRLSSWSCGCSFCDPAVSKARAVKESMTSTPRALPATADAADVSCASSSKSISELDGRARVGVSASCPSPSSSASTRECRPANGSSSSCRSLVLWALAARWPLELLWELMIVFISSAALSTLNASNTPKGSSLKPTALAPRAAATGAVGRGGLAGAGGGECGGVGGGR
mmetsp:Transcript_42965/g.63234  ORF Transcript_42965/g.63234 Transcript_42965/m.63234 type:complete len:201 (+) Transcript_42965:113-715(+)